MKRAIAFLLATLAPATASAYCPCYTASSSNNTHNCGVEAASGTNPTIAEWQPIFDLVAQGPSVWGNAGPSVSDIGQGCGKPEALHSVAARFPCEILKAIAMQESGWRQFCVPDTPSDQVGGASRTIISFDCGYGVGQVTSGMHAGETPAFDRARVASDATYNLATGTQILASKWKATNCVGDNQPSIVEDWYTSAWAYNGLAYSNNPSNPTYSSSRGVWNPSVGGAAPYQEKVFGWVEHPTGTPPRWTAVQLAYPDPSQVGGSGSPPDLDEPHCASPTDCTGTRPVHTSLCFATNPGDGGAGTGGSAGASGTGGGAGSTASAGASGSAGSAADGGPWQDAGSTGGTGAGTGGSGGKDGGAQQPGSASGSDSGCSCRSGAEPRGGASALLVALALFGLALSRRKR